MTGSHGLSEAEKSDWEQRLRESDAVEELRAAAGIEVTIDAFDRVRVVQEADRVEVVLEFEASEEDYVRIHSEWSVSEGTLEVLKLDDGFIAAPLAGHGRMWEYHDGEIIDQRWLS